MIILGNASNSKTVAVIVERRPGDTATCYADPSKALNELDWKTEKTLDDICRDSCNFILKEIEKNK